MIRLLPSRLDPAALWPALTVAALPLTVLLIQNNTSYFGVLASLQEFETVDGLSTPARLISAGTLLLVAAAGALRLHTLRFASQRLLAAAALGVTLSAGAVQFTQAPVTVHSYLTAPQYVITSSVAVPPPHTFEPVTREVNVLTQVSSRSSLRKVMDQTRDVVRAGPLGTFWALLSVHLVLTLAFLYPTLGRLERRAL